MNSDYEPVDVVFCFLDNINTTKLSFRVVRLAETSLDIKKYKKCLVNIDSGLRSV